MSHFGIKNSIPVIPTILNRSIVCRKTRNSVVVLNHLKFQISRSRLFVRRGDRAVEGARLEIVCTPNKGTGGSNPPLSARMKG